MRIRIAALGILLGLTSSLAFGQVSGGLRGTVLDTSGQPLASVVLLVRSASGSSEGQRTLSRADGRFEFTGLPAAGDYVLEASLPGHATVISRDIAVRRGQSTTINVQLPLASQVRERVEVRGAAPVVALDEQGTATSFSAETLGALPILGRNYQDVLALAPGVTDVDGDGNPNIHGARDTDVGTLLDGVNTTDPLTGKFGTQLNIESVQEIELRTSGASAEYGRAQGGIANVLTKSGGNSFEGTFKFYWRGSQLDGDGAGQDAPVLHGGVGETGLGELTFNDYMPFLSVSGPIVRDQAWFFASVEYIQRQDPVNAVSQAFVATTREMRTFAKATWQARPNHRLSLTYNSDPVERLNQGLNSLTREETGYTVQSGGPLLAARGASILSPTVLLETTASYMWNGPEVVPTLGPDTNQDGALYLDRNGNGFFEASERDPGEDYDGDGAFDVWEDTIYPQGHLDQLEEGYCTDAQGITGPSPPVVCAGGGVLVLIDEDGYRPPYVANKFYHASGDGDRRLTPPGGCEGAQREDIDCDGHLDNVNEDRNGNGLLDGGEDIDQDQKLDVGTEDRNGNGRLDDTPFPTGLYPYGRLKPLPADRNYLINLRSGLVSGPYFEKYSDERARGALRQDLSVFVPEFRGSHDFKVGYMVEHENFDRASVDNPVVAVNDPGWHTGTIIDQVTHPEIHYDCDPYLRKCEDPGVGRLTAILPLQTATQESASGWSMGTYLQDTWKPAPNVSLGLGVRFDRENLDTSGYTWFDAPTEGAQSRRLLALGKGEAADELVGGNGDGVRSLGIKSDPLVADLIGPASVWTTLSNALVLESARVLHHPASDLVFSSQVLEALYPGLFENGQADPDAIRALGVPVQQPEEFTVTNSNLAPRLSVGWDPAATGRTKLFATWGRYYDRLFLSTITPEQGLVKVERYYVLDRDAVDYSRQQRFGLPDTATPDQGFGTLLSNAPPTVTQVNRNLSTPFSDELTIGFDKEIAPEIAISARYISRRYRDQLQDIDVNHEVRIDPDTGALADRFGVLYTVIPSPGQPPAIASSPDGKPDLYVQNPFYNQVLRIGNYNDARYKAIEIELRRRLSRRWQMDASYSYSRAQGQAEEFQSRLGNDPSTLESEYGYLDYDQRHVVKLHGSAWLPHDWQIGGASVWASGLPYSVVSRFFAHDNVGYQQFRTRYGYTTADAGEVRFVPLSRNTGRNNSTLNIDLSVQRHFVMGKSTGSVMFEVFNLLGTDDLQIVSIEPNRTQGFDAQSLSVLNSPTQIDATRRFGRRYQLGFQVRF